MSENNKKYNLSLSRAYKIKGGFWSTDIGPAEFDAIQQIKLGGRLVIKEVPDESRKKASSPHAFFQYMAPDEVKAFKAKAGTRGKPTQEDTNY